MPEKDSVIESFTNDNSTTSDDIIEFLYGLLCQKN